MVIHRKQHRCIQPGKHMDTSPHTVHCGYIGISTYIVSIEMYNSLRSRQDTEPDEYWHGARSHPQCCDPLPVHQHDSVRVWAPTERCSKHSLTVHYKNSPNTQRRHKTNIHRGGFGDPAALSRISQLLRHHNSWDIWLLI